MASVNEKKATRVEPDGLLAVKVVVV